MVFPVLVSKAISNPPIWKDGDEKGGFRCCVNCSFQMYSWLYLSHIYNLQKLFCDLGRFDSEILLGDIFGIVTVFDLIEK